jgi:calmodulin
VCQCIVSCQTLVSDGKLEQEKEGEIVAVVDDAVKGVNAVKSAGCSAQAAVVRAAGHSAEGDRGVGRNVAVAGSGGCVRGGVAVPRGSQSKAAASRRSSVSSDTSKVSQQKQQQSRAMEVSIRYKQKNKGDGGSTDGAASKSGSDGGQTDKDRVWMRMYHFTAEQLQDLKEAFNDCDVTGSGLIRAHDVGTALRAAGQTPTEGDVQELLQDAVLDDTGSLNIDEFMRLVGSIGLKSEPEMEQEFEDALRSFDRDGRGVIEADLLKNALLSYGEPLDDEDVSEIMKIADIKGDGKIDYLEFVRKLTTK